MKHSRYLVPAALFALLLMSACYDMDRSQPASTARKMAAGESYDNAGASAYRGSSVASLAKVLRTADAWAEDSDGSNKQLIYNAEISVSVKDYKTAETALKQNLEALKGYISETNAYTNSEGKLNGSIKVRVPAKAFRAAITDIEKLGDVQSLREWTEDVSEEYVDVQSRIVNQKALEARLLTLLDHPGAKLKDLVAVEDKLSQVRTQIEQLEGRLRFLQNRIAYSIITITLFEPSSAQADRDSVLAPLSWALNQVGTLFFGSIGVVLLGIVGLLPWLILIYLLIKIIRHLRRKKPVKHGSKHHRETPHDDASGT